MRTVEDPADPDARSVLAHATRGVGGRPAGTGPSRIGLAGRLLVGAVVAVAATGVTITLAHAASARQVESIFVTPGAPPVPPQSQDPTGSRAPGAVAPPLTGQGGSLDDGLIEDPGPAAQSAAPQDPHSNG